MMRKFLLSLTIIAGAVAAMPAAEAAPVAAITARPIPVLDSPVSVQPVGYYHRGGHRYYRRDNYYRRSYYHSRYRR